MAESDYTGIQAGDRIEHFKSTIEHRMTYVVIGFVALQELVDGKMIEVVKVRYVADYDPSKVYVREINNMNDYIEDVSGTVVKRYTILEHDALSITERDELNELPEEKA